MASDPIEASSRFWWLWHNKFYETTGLTGYAFINNAKTKVEALLWYGTIILLAIFTINNVTKLVHYYQSKPTKTEVRITSNASDATIGNFTFKLKLPITEIYSAGPLLEWEWDDWYMTYNKPLSCQGPKKLMKNIEEAYDRSSQCLPFHMIPLIKTYNPDIPDSLTLDYYCKMEIPPDTLNMTYIGIVETEKLIQNLNNRYSETLDGIWSKMAGIQDGNYMGNLHNAVDNFNNLMEENVGSNFLTPFLLLKSMSDATIHNDLLFIKLFNATQYFQHSALSPEETLEEINKRLLDIAPFLLPNTSLSDTQFFVRDWNVDFADEARTWNDEETSLQREFGNSFTLEFQVRPPEGAQEFTMDINPPKQLIKFLFPFLHLDGFLYDEYFYRDNEFVYKLLACDITDWKGDKFDWLYDYFYTKPRTEFLEIFVYPAVEFYKKHSELKVNTGGGQFTLKPFHKYHINQLPMGQMISQTDDCLSITFGECLDLCKAEYTVEKCKCYPWNSYYLYIQSGIEICSEPCSGLTAEKDLCSSKCEQLSAHPCDRIVYRPEITSQSITALEDKTVGDKFLSEGKSILGDEFKLFSVEITIEPTMTFVKTVEIYEMTFTNFISEFGGLVEFWLGVNVIGIIHAFVYFLKQCCHCNREHKTGRTMRQLVTCTNKNNARQGVSSMDEETGVGVAPNMMATIDRRLVEMNRKIVKEINNINNRFKEMNRKTEEKIMKEIKMNRKTDEKIMKIEEQMNKLNKCFKQFEDFKLRK